LCLSLGKNKFSSSPSEAATSSFLSPPFKALADSVGASQFGVSQGAEIPLFPLKNHCGEPTSQKTF